jgi:hypothetical protein
VIALHQARAQLKIRFGHLPVHPPAPEPLQDAGLAGRVFLLHLPRANLLAQRLSLSRRGTKGKFSSQQVKVGRSLSSDRRSKAKTVVKKGEGDRGDRPSD